MLVRDKSTSVSETSFAEMLCWFTA